MMKNICLLCLSFILAACATQYVAPDSVLNKSKSLDKSSAIKILRFQLTNFQEQDGVIKSLAPSTGVYTESQFKGLDDNANLYASGTIIEHKVTDTKVENSNSSTKVSVYGKDTYKRGTVRLNLNTISQIRIEGPKTLYDDPVDRPDSKESIYLSITAIDSSNAKLIMIRVAMKNFDEILAALLALSPEAALKYGMGF